MADTVPVGTSFLERLEADQRDRLVGLGVVRRYPAGSIIFFEGDHGHDVILVRTGSLKVAATVEGREVVLDVLGGGDVLGEVAAVDGRPRSATLTALTMAEIVRIPADVFMAFLVDHPTAALTLMRDMAGRLRDASRRQIEYGALDAVGRVCRRLVEMMERFGQPTASGVLIKGPLTQGDIAAWAGLSREAVVKALHALRTIGWVATSPRSITVVDVVAVTTRAALDPISQERIRRRFGAEPSPVPAVVGIDESSSSAKRLPPCHPVPSGSSSSPSC